MKKDLRKRDFFHFSSFFLNTHEISDGKIDGGFISFL